MPNNQPPLLHPYVQMALSGTAMLPPQDELAAYCLELHSLIAELARPANPVTRSAEVQTGIEWFNSLGGWSDRLHWEQVKAYIAQLEASQPKPQSDEGLAFRFNLAKKALAKDPEGQQTVYLDGTPALFINLEHPRWAEIQAALSRQAPVPKPDTNDEGLLEGLGVFVSPLGNGWSFVWKQIVGEDFVQLVDRNGCPLLEGFMVDAAGAAEEFSAAPVPTSGAVEAEELICQQFADYDPKDMTVRKGVAAIIQQAMDGAEQRGRAQGWLEASNQLDDDDLRELTTDDTPAYKAGWRAAIDHCVEELDAERKDLSPSALVTQPPAADGELEGENK